MKTLLLKINSSFPEKNKINNCANIVSQGGLVAFPTETVYGLGANALDSRAVKKIFVAKGRPQDNPMIVHVANRKQVEGLVKFIPKKAIIFFQKVLIEKSIPSRVAITI